MMNDSNYFRDARQRVGLTQLDASIKIGVTYGAVSAWERGGIPSLKFVDKICEVYRLDRDTTLRVMANLARPRRPRPATTQTA